MSSGNGSVAASAPASLPAAGRRAAAVRAAAAEGLVTEDSPVVGFIDLAGIAASQAELERAFCAIPATVLHAFAAKASSLVPVLRLFADAGMGCEAASAGELAQALAAGFAPERIVLDSPAKTASELRQALRLGVTVNADNFAELERIDGLLRDLGLAQAPPPLGLRINPQVGAGTIAAMSTASTRSKFGVPLRDEGGRQAVLDAFDRYPWLNQLHVHVGSQGCPLELIAAGIRDVYELAEQINAGPGGRRVTRLDIGGGLPVNFADDRVAPTFAAYAEVLRAAVPGLFDGRYDLVTEFGRALSAKNGFTLARVEYAKQVDGRRVALTHAGAQVATRTVFMPESWPLRLSGYGPDGLAKRGPVRSHDVAGPCCFAGDLLAAGRDLEQLDEDDLVLLHDTGGYYFTATWTYNSLPRPAVYGFRVEADGAVRFTLMRRQQTLDEIVAEAGGDPAAVHAAYSTRHTAEPFLV
jgi:diaminopimelate decarboxylase